MGYGCERGCYYTFRVGRCQGRGILIVSLKCVFSNRLGEVRMVSMEISYLGHASFKLRGKQLTVITDPFDSDKVGLKWTRQTADVVAVSHDHGDHNYVEGVKSKEGDPMIISAPGEYETREVRFTGWKTYHDQQQGEERGKNTVYKIEIDGVKVLHLGDLGHELPEDLIDDLGDVDVLLVPVGGHFTINAAQAGKVVRQVDPRIVIPMHYKRDEMKAELKDVLSDVAVFLDEMGVENVEPVAKLNVNAGSLPEDVQVVVME